jgi:hypothetical protein
MPSGLTRTMSARRKRWLALFCLLGVCGIGGYAAYTTNVLGGKLRAVPPSKAAKPAERTQRSSTRYASTGGSVVARGLGSVRIGVRFAGRVLYPGAAPYAIRITLRNPSSVSMFVMRLTVTVRASPAGCAAARNISLVQSIVSSAAPVELHPHGTVTLPAHGRLAPTIQLRNRPVNQVVCQNARFPLSVTVSAHS